MSKPTKRVLFSYLLLSNIGCEIIVRGTIKFLTRTFSNEQLEFIVPSYHVSRDQALLADISNVRIIPMLQSKRIIRGILRKLGLFTRFWTPRFSSIEFKKADLFVSIGGDIYTMFGNSLPNDWLGYEAFATRHGIPSIMFGANMERFETLSQDDRTLLIEHLRRFKALIVRDIGTVDYLREFGVSENVDFHPDPAFLLRTQPVFTRRPIKRIAINFTPILVREFGEDGVAQFVRITEALVAKGYEVTFVPHVYSSDGLKGLSDPDALRRLHGALMPETQEKITIIEDNLSFKTVGDALAKVDLFIGGRMHGCLNSLTLGKAVCFVGYSKKVRTMVDWLSKNSPFEAVSQSFDAVPADELDMVWLERLIAAHDAWAAEDPEGKSAIDMKTYLESLSASATVAERLIV